MSTISFIIYNGEGTILRVGQCPDSMMNYQAGDGEYVMKGTAPSDGSQIIVQKNIGDVVLSSGLPVVVEVMNHPYDTGDVLTFSDIVGTVELNGNSYTITKVDIHRFSLNDTDGDDFTAYDSGGTAIGPTADDNWTPPDPPPPPPDYQGQIDDLDDRVSYIENWIWC